jgi:hypothetical protein
MWGRDNVEANKRTGRREGQSLAGAECGGYEGSKGHDEVAGQVRTEWTGREDEEKLKLEEREEAEGPGGAAFFFWLVRWGPKRDRGGLGIRSGDGHHLICQKMWARRKPAWNLEVQYAAEQVCIVGIATIHCGSPHCLCPVTVVTPHQDPMMGAEEGDRESQDARTNWKLQAASCALCC